MRVTVDTPRVSIFLHKGRRAIERITALGAEEVAGVPLSTACNDDFAFDGRLAALASWREELVEVKVAVEASGLISAIFLL